MRIYFILISNHQSLSMKAYKRLKNARRYPEESLSQVIMRAVWPENTITGKELLERLNDEVIFFKDEELDEIEKLKSSELQYTENKFSHRAFLD